MTRRPPLAPQAVARAWWAKVRKQGFTWRRFERPQLRPGFGWLLLAAGLLFFFGHASVGSQRPKRHRQMRLSSRPDTAKRTPCSRRESCQTSLQRPHGAMSPRNTTQGQLCTPMPPSLRAGWSQLGGGDWQGRIEGDTSVLPTTREWRSLRHCPAACPGELSKHRKLQ